MQYLQQLAKAHLNCVVLFFLKEFDVTFLSLTVKPVRLTVTASYPATTADVTSHCYWWWLRRTPSGSGSESCRHPFRISGNRQIKGGVRVLGNRVGRPVCSLGILSLCADNACCDVAPALPPSVWNAHTVTSGCLPVLLRKMLKPLVEYSWFCLY